MRQQQVNIKLKLSILRNRRCNNTVRPGWQQEGPEETSCCFLPPDFTNPESQGTNAIFLERVAHNKHSGHDV